MQQSLIQALGIINCSVLKRHGEGVFEILHSNDDWFYQLCPEAKGQQRFSFADSCSYMQDFFIDAENFWKIGIDGQIQSGIWTEQVPDFLLRLEAIAAVSNGDSYLVINNLEEQYDKQQSTVQVARELLLSNDKILAQHEYLHERLEALLAKNLDLESLLEPVNKALERANFAVMICDSQLNAIKQNPDSYNLFNISTTEEKAQPIALLLSLLNQQFPEFDRVFSSNSQWNGELFWQKSPSSNKWLQVAIYPVKDEQNSAKYWIFIVSDISRMKYLVQRNEKLNQFDNVTELPNRQYFWKSLERAIGIAQPFFVLFLDVKHFKRVNELHGHHGGDQLLVDIGRRLTPLLDDDNLMARIGGNEFAVILHNMNSQTRCERLANRMIEAVEQPFYSDNQQKILVGLNVGVASCPLDACNAEELMKLADLAMFNAKRETKSTIKLYSKALKEASDKRLALEEALRKAIDEDQFELYLQPILDLKSEKIVKAEALLRWRTSDGSLIGPDVFIPVAEQTGLIVPIGKWVITRAAQMLSKLQNIDADLKISVNLSPRQIADRRLFNFILVAIQEAKIPAKNIELELTEGVLIDNFNQVQRLLSAVRDLGISIAIDDFGTGYSSLAYIQKLPIDHLKIDRSFVRDLDNNDNDKAIVLAVIAMAHSLKISVIAEGVETQSQKEFLRENKCDSVQGFLFSRPIPFDDFCALLRDQSE